MRSGSIGRRATAASAGWSMASLPLKVGSATGIASPPAIWLPDGRIVTPDIRDAERLQGFPPGWTETLVTAGRPRYRWSLVGNAVAVPVSEWVGRLLTASPSTLPTSRRPTDARCQMADGRLRKPTGPPIQVRCLELARACPAHPSRRVSSRDAEAALGESHGGLSWPVAEKQSQAAQCFRHSPPAPRLANAGRSRPKQAIARRRGLVGSPGTCQQPGEGNDPNGQEAGGTTPLIGRRPAPDAGHRPKRHRARDGAAIRAAPARAAIPSAPGAAARDTPPCRHRLSEAAPGGLRRRLLLAWLSAAWHAGQGERCLLAAEDRKESRTGSGRRTGSSTMPAGWSSGSGNTRTPCEQPTG